MAQNGKNLPPLAPGEEYGDAVPVAGAPDQSAAPVQAQPTTASPAGKLPTLGPNEEYGGTMPHAGSADAGTPQMRQPQQDTGFLSNVPDVNKDFNDAETAQGIELRDHVIGGIKGLVEAGYYGSRAAQWLVNKIAATTPGMTKGMGEVIPAQEPEMLKAQNPAEARGKVIEGVLEFFLGDEAFKSMGVADKLKEATGLAKILEKSPNLARAFHIGTTMARTGVVQGAQSMAHGATPTEAAEAGAGTGVTAGVLDTLGQVAGSGAPRVVKAAARVGQAGVGAGIAVKGAEQALTPQQPGETPVQASTRHTAGAVQGIMGAGGVMESAGEAASSIKEALSTPLPTKEQAVGQVFNTKGKAREANLEAMTALKGSGVNLTDQTTMPKMKQTLQTKIDQNQAYIDKVLGENERIYTPDELQERFPVSGRNDVKVVEPAKRALQMLEAHYDKSGNPQEAAKVGALSHKYQTEGLTLLDLNNLARQFGTEFDNVYKKSKDQGFVVKDADQPIEIENIRQMLKNQIRERMPDEDLKKIDEQTSNLIKTRNDSDTFILRLEDIENRIQQAPGWQKLTGKLGDAAHFVFGSFFQKLLALSPKETEMNVAQMAERMPKAMKVLDQLLKARPEDMLNQMEFMVSPREPAPKEPEGQQAPASGSQIPAALNLKWDEPHIDNNPRGWDTKATLNHELGHAAVAHQLGFPPIEIRSSEHPKVDGVASTHVDWSGLETDKAGHVEPATLRDRMDDILTTIFGGAAANELYDGIPWRENNGLVNDLQEAHDILNRLGFDHNEHDGVIENAVERAKSMLSDEKVSDVINEFSDTREPRLDKTLHYSSPRMLEFTDRIDEARNAGNQTGVNEHDLEHGAAVQSKAAAGSEGSAAAPAGLPQGLAATAVSVPAELSTGSAEVDKAIKEGGAIPGGLQKGDADTNVPDLVLFHDPTTGSTLALKADAVTPEKVKAELEKSRAQYAVAAKPKVSEKQAKIEGAAVKGHPEWTQASLEREIARAKSILRNPDATPEEKAYGQQLLETSRELQQNPKLANLNAKDDEYSDRASDFVSEDYLPEKESEGDYAKLWHVTTAKDKVLAEGLKSRRQTGSVGLGGGINNEMPGKVSVTFDEAHANQIASRMRLAVDAAQDKVTPQHVLDQMISDVGISDDTPYEVADALGAPEEVHEDWEKFNEWFNENYKQEDAYELVQKLDDAAAHIYADAEATTPFRVGFTASKEQMAKIDPEQIEIMEVEARKGAKAHHVGAEAELRFDPADLRIKK